MRRIVLYSKKGCHLCDAVRALIEHVVGDQPIALDVVDITQSAELYQRYWDVIPVVEIEDGPTFVSRVGELELREALEGKR